ncbi:response regulator [Flavobacterium qiangtangense]|uniref:Response regulator n=1 Tax=Flavobacterium qiangtangense TaxID=1442595 RepID=A0ABW1PM62_9FLAO
MKKLRNLHILIAEDDFDDGEVILESFKKHPLFLKVEILRNGKQLLDYLNDETKSKPDLILTDLNMPIINGLEVLKEICHHPEFKKITTFAYSTSSNPVYQAKCIDFGAKAFLTKPTEISEFDEIPQKIIQVVLQNL